MTRICDGIVDGMAVRRICNADDLPSYRTFLRHIQEDDAAHDAYRKARAIQCEILRDDIIDLVEAPLPTDPKLAMAEVQRRRLEADQKDKYIRQLQPLGVRNKAEDAAESKVSGTITLKWDDGSTQKK